jgi:hypothetical protein
VSLQSDRLAMAGLGVLGDAPPDQVQPMLPDGVHLRWARRQDLGFPPYGYFLFCREHREGEFTCLGPVLRSAPVGGWPDDMFATPFGQLVSDAPLLFTDDFAPTGTPELDLQGRHGVRFAFDAASVSRRVQVTVGLRASAGTTCVDLSTVDTLPNPFTSWGVAFQVASVQQCQIQQWNTTTGQRAGLDCGRKVDITLPTPASQVRLVLTSFGTPATAVALDADGKRVATARMAPGSGVQQVLELRHAGIATVTVTAPSAETALHEVCHTPDAAAAPIAITALAGGTPIAATTVEGAAGAVVAVELAADLITAVDVGAGPAALVDLCFVPVAQGAGAGWQPVPRLAQPIALPVQDPNYPARQGPADLAGSQALALSRIRYGQPADWAAPFADLHGELQKLVTGNGITTYAGVPDPADAGFEPPATEVHTLDLLAIAAVNPAVAQQLGVYWVDETADPQTRYDYLVVADDTGVAKLDANRVLAEIATGFGTLDGWIAFDLTAQAAAPVDAPAQVRSYALPAAPIQRAGGQAIEPLPGVGLTWALPEATPGELRPGAALLYHVWRADLADGTDPVPIANWDLRTKDRPLLLGAAALPAGAVIAFAADWPPFRLWFTDNALPEGWYGYAITGVDVFGRHSARSEPASWRQWAPAPNPAPWYYRQPAGDAEIHPWAVRLLDTTPPPPPTAVAAWALDPGDPLVVRDAAYQAWRSTVDSALVGLRVGWEWPYRHAQQAPDVREFRVYANPGSDLPVDPRHATSWRGRYSVCAYDENVTVSADADGNPLRRYEVFLPAPADALPEPTLAGPLRYALVAVTAADGRQHAVDSPQWAGTPLGDRFGNEGPTSGVARIYRVRRAIPDPPVPSPADGDAVFATPADYHARSYYTYRWRPAQALTTHVLRALDDAVFRADWVRRPRADIGAGDLVLFPPQADEPRWDAAKRAQVAAELNALNARAADFSTARAAYAGLSNDALRVLAGLPETAKAFVQVTASPLDPADPATADHAGPDNPATYQPDPNLRAYVDTLDGRSVNRYFYRSRYLDAVGNLGEPSLAGPPVCLPNVVPPRAPSLTAAKAGDRAISLGWAHNREPDLAAYRVYRTDGDASDIRLMTLVHTENAPSTGWTDTGIEAARTYSYRVTAIDDAGNESAPSPAIAGRAYDDSRPDPPTWDPPGADGALSWTAADPDLACLVERQIDGAQAWEPLSGWLPRGRYEYADTTRVAGLTYRYRLRVRDTRGRGNRDFASVSA